jgi:hypothetical protein
VIQNFIKQNLKTTVGITLGTVAGYLYWKFIGCNFGSCAITSKPINFAIYGAIMGGLLVNIFQKNPKKETND